MGLINQEKFDHLRNDIYTIWIKHPGLTIMETISLLRKQRLLDRPQRGLKDYLFDLKKEFDKRPTRARDSIDDLDKDDSPLGSNPFMER